MIVSCGPGVSDLSREDAPLAFVRGRLSGSPPLRDGEPPRNLRAALVWAGIPVVSPFCLTYGDNPLLPDKTETSSIADLACKDLLSFTPGVVEVSVPLEPGQIDFEIPLAFLPVSNALIGQDSNRVGYGSVWIFDDRNNDGTINGLGLCERQEEPDVILAASFSSLQTAQERIVYREGEFDRESFFFPAPGCEAPMPGYSVWRVGALLDEPDCINDPLRAGISISYATEPKARRALQQLICPGLGGWPRNPMIGASFLEFKDEEKFRGECLNEETWVVTEKDCECPRVDLFTLTGCPLNEDCRNPAWDNRENLPPEWPCTEAP